MLTGFITQMNLKILIVQVLFLLFEAISSTDHDLSLEKTSNFRSNANAYGVDVDVLVSSSEMSCFASSGITFFIPRGYHSTGSVDTNVCTNLKTAYSAKISYRDTYMFPCPTCSKTAAQQVNELVTYLQTNCKTEFSGRIWLDIEGEQYWTGSTSSNQKWYESLVDACNGAKSVSCGIYSNENEWIDLFGSTSFKYGNQLPLWYAHYDNAANFNDFVAFGGWTKAYAKQYEGDVTVCGVDVDKDWAPTYSG